MKNQNKHWILNKKISVLIGAAAFFFIFFIRYLWIGSDLYQFRDDGIITLSHAKNLIDFGFIGINPSGGIVEGFSAPLQFLIYVIVYSISHLGYEAFIQTTTIVCTMSIGALVIFLFQDRECWAYLICLLFAIFLSFQSSFIEWHGSGMENPITHTLFLSTIIVFTSFLQNKKINFYFAFIPFLASISRIDSIFHIIPVLGLFSVFWYLIEKNMKGFLFAFLVLILWFGFHFCRYLYFGDWYPNTAYAQDISIQQRIQALLHFDKNAINQTFYLSKQIFISHGGYYLILLVFIPLMDFKQKYIPSILMSLSFVLTSLVYPAFFGPTRLDFGRSNSHMPMFVFLLLVCLYFSLKTKKIKIIFLASSIFLCFFVSIKFFIKPYYLCCGLSGFEQSHQQFKKIASEENISRPTVANPDLGIMSWYKDINILDLGMIGSPVLSKIKSAPIASDFIFEFLSPDIIQSHDIWSCVHYETIFSDIRFKKMYQPVKEEFIQSKSRCRGKILRNGIWIRKNILKSSTSRERMLLDKLSHELNLNIVQDELEYCKSSKFENCSYISRTAYKFLPEFKDKGMYDQLLLIFSNAQITNDFDLYLLKGSIEKNLDKKALAYIVDRHNGKILNQVPTTGADPSVR